MRCRTWGVCFSQLLGCFLSICKTPFKCEKEWKELAGGRERGAGAGIPYLLGAKTWIAGSSTSALRLLYSPRLHPSPQMPHLKAILLRRLPDSTQSSPAPLPNSGNHTATTTAVRRNVPTTISARLVGPPSPPRYWLDAPGDSGVNADHLQLWPGTFFVWKENVL